MNDRSSQHNRESLNGQHPGTAAANANPAPRRIPGDPSKVEAEKAASDYLRGHIKEVLDNPDATEFPENELNLLKVHGIYQQYDRDNRKPKSQREHTLMVRARIPSGILTAEQYLQLDDLARQYGNGSIRLTTRQSIQYHGILKGDARSLIRGMNAKLVSTLAACGDVMRNVMCCPAILGDPARVAIQKTAEEIGLTLAPQSGAYHDVWLNGEKLPHDHPYMSDVERAAKDEFDVEPWYGKLYLPRKFKVGIAMPDDNCIDLYSQDCALIAIVNEKTRAVTGYNVLVGGGFGMTHRKADTFARLATPAVLVKPEHAVDAVRVVIEIFRDYGNREDRRHARLKYLIEEFGMDWFVEEFKKYAKLPSPLKNGAGVTGFEAFPPVDLPLIEYRDHLGWEDQGDGLWSYGLFVENGRLTDNGPHKLTGVRAVVERFQPGVRITPHQNIIFTHVAPDDRETLLDILREHKVPLNDDFTKVRLNSMACPALPTCGLALGEAERSLPDVLDQLEPLLEELGIDQADIGIRMTGCPNGCARPYTADIGFVGRSPGVYDVYLGGRLAGDRLCDVLGEKIKQEEFPSLLRPILEQFAEERLPEEGLGDWWQRISGRTEPKTILTGAKDIYNPTLRGEPMG